MVTRRERIQYRKDLGDFVFKGFPEENHIRVETLLQIMSGTSTVALLSFLASVWEYGKEIRLEIHWVFVLFGISFFYL